jgi:ABC-type dipeptide/oligopeptide/nickel transport system permease subunit
MSDPAELPPRPESVPLRVAPIADDAARIVEGRGPWQLAWARLRRDRVAIASAIVILCIIAVALAAPLIARAVGHTPEAQYTQTGLTPAGIPVGPSRTFWFGTDDLGRDVFTRVVYGTRISLIAGVLSSVLAVFVGVGVGRLSGYAGRTTDTILSRLMDVVLSLPYLVFAIALVSVIGPSLGVSIAVIAFFSWASVGRIVRAETLSIREKEYIEAARSLGAGSARIMIVDILPNVLAPAIVYATMLIPLAISFEATLSFLGLGVVPPTPTWGNMLASSMTYYRVAWWFVVFPGAALLGTTVAFNLLGDGVRDAFDPRYEQLRAGSEEP